MTMVDSLKKDIEHCDELISRGFASQNDLDMLISKYKNKYSNIGSGITYIATAPGGNPNYIQKIKQLRNELEGLIIMEENANLNNNPNISPVNVIVNNYIEVKNSIELINKINNDLTLTESQKIDLTNIIKEAEKIKDISDTKEKKSYIKLIVDKVLDKGLDLAIGYLPLILQFVFSLINGK